MGIKTNPLKETKKQLDEEKNKGIKPYRQKIEETQVLMVDSGQVVCFLDNYFHPPPPTKNLKMKITSWNIRGMNSPSKQRMLKEKISRIKEDIFLL